MQSLLTFAAAIGILGVAIGALAKWVIIPASRFVGKMVRFLEDWNGEPARPGYVGRDGVMKRLESTEHKAGRAEFHLGNGNPIPMRDVVMQINRDVATLQERQKAIEKTVTQEFKSPNTGGKQ